MCCENGVLEVKYPYCAQMKRFEEVAESNKQFYLVKDSEDNMILNHKHSYYQCQMRISVTETSSVTLLFSQRVVIFFVNAYYLIQILFQYNLTLPIFFLSCHSSRIT